jgi:hypothetical protein
VLAKKSLVLILTKVSMVVKKLWCVCNFARANVFFAIITISGRPIVERPIHVIKASKSLLVIQINGFYGGQDIFMCILLGSSY